MSLPHRVINTITTNLFHQFFTQLHKSAVHQVALTVLPGCPPLDDIERDISLVFTNSHPVFHYQRPMTPEMVEIGGIHCKEAKPLPTVSSCASFPVRLDGKRIDSDRVRVSGSAVFMTGFIFSSWIVRGIGSGGVCGGSRAGIHHVRGGIGHPDERYAAGDAGCFHPSLQSVTAARHLAVERQPATPSPR